MEIACAGQWIAIDAVMSIFGFEVKISARAIMNVVLKANVAESSSERSAGRGRGRRRRSAEWEVAWHFFLLVTERRF